MKIYILTPINKMYLTNGGITLHLVGGASLDKVHSYEVGAGVGGHIKNPQAYRLGFASSGVSQSDTSLISTSLISTK